MSENHFDIVLEELTAKSAGRLITDEVFDASAFQALNDHIWKKAEGLQAEYCISKQVLRSIRLSCGAIRSRAGYLPEVREQLQWADRFEEMLDRLIAGETRLDRVPKAPRIV